MVATQPVDGKITLPQKFVEVTLVGQGAFENSELMWNGGERGRTFYHFDRNICYRLIEYDVTWKEFAILEALHLSPTTG